MKLSHIFMFFYINMKKFHQNEKIHKTISLEFRKFIKQFHFHTKTQKIEISSSRKELYI